MIAGRHSIVHHRRGTNEANFGVHLLSIFSRLLSSISVRVQGGISSGTVAGDATPGQSRSWRFVRSWWRPIVCCCKLSTEIVPSAPSPTAFATGSAASVASRGVHIHTVLVSIVIMAAASSAAGSGSWRG
jgi:hypothetical protein